MERFLTEAVAHTPNPQQVIYAAMHQDYADNFIWDERCDRAHANDAGSSNQQLQGEYKEATPQSGRQMVRQHQIAHHSTGSPKFSKLYLPKQVNKLEIRIHQKSVLRKEVSRFRNALKHYSDLSEQSPPGSSPGQELRPPLRREQLIQTVLTLYHSRLVTLALTMGGQSNENP